MRHQHQRGAAPVLLLEDEVDDAGARIRIKIASGFVRRQNQWIGSERPRQRDALLLAAGKLAWIMRKALAKTHRRQLLRRARKSVGSAGEFKRRRDIFKRGHGRDELEGLEHNAYVFTTKTRQRILVELCQIAPVDARGAGVGPLQTGESHQKCGFPRPGGANEADRLTSRYV